LLNNKHSFFKGFISLKRADKVADSLELELRPNNMGDEDQLDDTEGEVEEGMTDPEEEDEELE